MFYLLFKLFHCYILIGAFKLGFKGGAGHGFGLGSFKKNLSPNVMDVDEKALLEERLAQTQQSLQKAASTSLLKWQEAISSPYSL